MAVMQDSPKGCEHAQMIVARSYAPGIKLRDALSKLIDETEDGVVAEMRQLKYGRRKMTHVAVGEHDRLFLVSMRVAYHSRTDRYRLNAQMRTATGYEALRTVTCTDCRALMDAMKLKRFHTTRTARPLTDEEESELNAHVEELDIRRRVDEAAGRLAEKHARSARKLTPYEAQQTARAVADRMLAAIGKT